MNSINSLALILVVISLTSLLSVAVNAQVVRSRGQIPTGILVRSEGPAVRTAPSAQQQNTVEADGIRDIEATVKDGVATIKFRARPNVSPTVELGAEPPRNGLGGQLEFKTRAGFSYTRRDLGEPIYRAEFPYFQVEDPGTRFYYIITIAGDQDIGTRQAQGYFDIP